MSAVPPVPAGPGSLPALGFGTWALRGAVARTMVRTALEIGYRHLDTAAMYGNEREVGAGIVDSGVPREEIFLTTKVWPDRFADGDLQASAAESLDRLGVEQADLLLLHWPSEAVPLEETLGALGEVADSGRARLVGVSNFPVDLLEKAHRRSPVPIACNQVEYHPELDQRAVLEATRRLGLALVAYSPLGKGALTRHPGLRAIGAAHGKSAAQVALRWLIQQPGVSAIPRTSDPGRARSNFEIFDFELSPQEMAEVAALSRTDGRRTDPVGLAPRWD